MSRRVVRVGLVLAVPLLLVLFLRAFVLDVYRVDSGSMEPTIHGAADGGELVLVHYDRAPQLRRFDLVVVLREGEREPAVKRVVGLPGEEVRIGGGDLFIDGARLAADAPRPRGAVVFDSRCNDLREDFDLEGAWVERGGTWAAASVETARASYRHALRDDHLGPDGRRVLGMRQVGDAGLECEVLCTDFPATLTLALTEEADEFEARVEFEDESTFAVTVVRRTGDGGEQPLIARHRKHDLTRPIRVAFWNIDDAVALEAGGVWTQTYSGNQPLEEGPDPRFVHRRPRARIEVSGGAIEIQRLCLLRDLHYTGRGTFGTAEPVLLGPQEVFLLGDNSAESVDGREWGPVTRGEILGRPVAVVWPPGRVRLLRSTEPSPQRP